VRCLERDSAAKFSASDLIGFMQDVVRRVSPQVEYIDSLYTNSRMTSISKDSTEENLSQPFSTSGVVFRMLKRGEWREAAFGDLRDKGSLIEQTKKAAGFTPISSHSVQKTSHGKPWKTDAKMMGQKDPRDIEAKEKLEKVRRNFQIAKSYDSRIINVNSNYREIIDERIFVNSEGSELHQQLSRVNFAVESLAKENDRLEYDYCFGGRTGGFEVVDELVTEQNIKDASKGAIELLRSHQVPTGTFNVVLDSGMTGTFAHESFGHGCEADQVLRGRSYLVNYLNKKLGPENFNLYDDGTLTSGTGSLVFDDEGNPTHKTAIVEKGVLTHFMQDRMSAEEMKVNPTGNARRESYKRMIYVRMTNTYIEPGDYDFGELIKETKDGIFLEHWNSGIEDPIGGNMQLKSKKSWRIKNGEIDEPFSTTVLSGKVLDFTTNIKGITKASDFAMSPGFCGKGHEDVVTSGAGGTFLASRATIGQG
jgi:TldD protein